MRLPVIGSLWYLCLARLLLYAFGYAFVFHRYVWRVAASLPKTGLEPEMYSGALDEIMLRIFLFLYLVYFPLTTWLLLRFAPVRRLFPYRYVIAVDVIDLYVGYVVSGTMIQG